MPDPENVSRVFRLHAFEFLIFVIMAVLCALCLCAAPLLAADGPSPGPPYTASGGPR